MQILLGMEVEDVVTGFRGIVMGQVEYLTGCEQVLVQPHCELDGKWVESRWFDSPRCKIIDKNPVVIDGLSFGEDIQETEHPDIPARRSGADTPAPRV